MDTAAPVPEPAPASERPTGPIGRDWILAGVALLILGWLAGRTSPSNVAGFATAILIGGGLTMVLGALMQRRPISPSAEVQQAALRLLPRLNTFEANSLSGGPLLLKNGSNSNTLIANSVSNAEFGFRIVESHQNTFTGNTAADNEIGFRIARANGNTFTGNQVTGDGTPLRITGKGTNVFTDNVGLSTS